MENLLDIRRLVMAVSKDNSSRCFRQPSRPHAV